MASIVQSLSDLVKSIFELIGSFFQTAFNILRSAFEGIFNLFEGIISAILQLFRGAIQAVGGVGKFIIGTSTSRSRTTSLLLTCGREFLRSRHHRHRLLWLPRIPTQSRPCRQGWQQEAELDCCRQSVDGNNLGGRLHRI